MPRLSDFPCWRLSAMTKSMLFTTLAAATLAFGLAACDEQQATDQSTPPMQQQGAVPPTDDSGSSPTAPTAPQGTETPTAPGSDMPSMRSEEHTSELQSLMRIAYAVFCLKKK